jgi:hypothetical protein
MRAADAVLAGHIAPTALFKFLEQLTLQTVSYSNFDMSVVNDEIKVSMDGVARSVNSIALQADLLSKSGTITNPIFSNINRAIDGVRFDFTAEVNPAALNYRTIVGAPPPQTQVQQQQQAAPSPFGSSEQQQPQQQQQQATTTR